MFAVVAGAIVLAVARRRRRRSIGARVTRLREALRRISAHPEYLAGRQPSVSRKVAAAGGSAIASVLGRRLAKRLVSGLAAPAHGWRTTQRKPRWQVDVSIGCAMRAAGR